MSRVALRVYGYLSFDCPLVYERAIPERTIVLDFLTNFFLWIVEKLASTLPESNINKPFESLFSIATCAVINVPKTLFFTPSARLCSTIGTCL